MRLVIFSVVSVGLMFLLAAFLVSRIAEVSLVEMTRDPLNTLDAPVYTGSISNLGVLVWVGSAAICLCAGLVLRAVRTLAIVAR